MTRKPGTITTAVLLLAAAPALLVRQAPVPATRPAPPTTRSRPKPAEYPPKRLVEAAERAAKEMLGRTGPGFRAVVRPPFVVIGNLPAGEIRRLAAGSVVRPARAMWRSHFRRRPTDVITVLLFRDAKTYQAGARKLFGDTDVPYFGYYRPARRALVMNIATGTGTLVHELTHALIAYDFPSVPTWFNEGLASLHEQCTVSEDGIVGAVNWRLPALQKAIRAKTLRPLGELIARDDFYGRLRGLNYAQARYFVMYMQEKRLLRGFYRRFRSTHAKPGAAVGAIEAVFGKRLKEVEAEYLKWALTLRWPRR